jgi:hypothetical protein
VRSEAAASAAKRSSNSGCGRGLRSSRASKRSALISANARLSHGQAAGSSGRDWALLEIRVGADKARDFQREGVTAVAASVVKFSLCSAATMVGMTTELNRIAAEDFESVIGQPLLVQGSALALQLQAVERSPHPTGRELPGFSLLLLGPPQPLLAQGMIELEHPQLGVLALFMTPIGQDPAGCQYQIVFN